MAKTSSKCNVLPIFSIFGWLSAGSSHREKSSPSWKKQSIKIISISKKDNAEWFITLLNTFWHCGLHIRDQSCFHSMGCFHSNQRQPLYPPQWVSLARTLCSSDYKYSPSSWPLFSYLSFFGMITDTKLQRSGKRQCSCLDRESYRSVTTSHSSRQAPVLVHVSTEKATISHHFTL